MAGVFDIKSIIGVYEVNDMKKLLRHSLAEFLGTFLYIALVLQTGTIGFALRNHAGSGEDVDNVTIALANGLLVATIVQMIAHISGGHINPAVTIGSLVCGRIKLFKAVLYTSMQIIGSIIGGFVAYAVSSDVGIGNLAATIPDPKLSAAEVFALELLQTFVLVATVLSTERKNGSGGLGYAPLAIGLSITACQICCVNYTGSLNPVRSFGPAVVMNIWVYHWVYWVAPILGGSAAGLVYRYVLTMDNEMIAASE